ANTDGGDCGARPGGGSCVPVIADEPAKSSPSPRASPGAPSFWPSLIQSSLRSSLQTGEPWPLPVEFPGPEIQERETQIRIARIVASRSRLQIVLRLQQQPPPTPILSEPTQSSVKAPPSAR
ncbi:MAG: hypothetical protein WCK86_01815, partial [Planctomycetia bacterium]